MPRKWHLRWNETSVSNAVCMLKHFFKLTNVNTPAKFPRSCLTTSRICSKVVLFTEHSCSSSRVRVLYSSICSRRAWNNKPIFSTARKPNSLKMIIQKSPCYQLNAQNNKQLYRYELYEFTGKRIGWFKMQFDKIGNIAFFICLGRRSS